MDDYRNPPPDTLDAVFAALADRTRRAMVQRLAAGERSVSELAAPFDMSLAAASKHIRVLEGAGLVRREVLGRVHRVRLDAKPLHAGMEWIRHYEAFWAQRLDALAALLEADAGGARSPSAGARPAAAARSKPATPTRARASAKAGKRRP